MSTVFVISTPNHLCVQDKTQRTHIATDGYKNTARMSSPDAYALPEPALSEPDGRGQTDLPARTAPALHPTLLFSQTFVGVECRFTSSRLLEKRLTSKVKFPVSALLKGSTRGNLDSEPICGW
ncbi:hypothetical protein Y032_0557g3406 [Ancylostoma ceylanicum]|uniref:Uncharacterized protein n=1 Tax=Ancylostoma ceylanicum TaxID=53326 RepID=A0A016WPN8_9BILA|nr:hypothetical protein Y032_0557g3406 [Ancylostoma ceylanicum]